MRLMKSLQVPLILGIVIGLMALWASAAPSLATGTSVIGGYLGHVVNGWWAYGCNSTTSCEPCNLNGNSSAYCQDAHAEGYPYPSWNCAGGYLTIVSSGGDPGNVIHGGSWAGCTNLAPGGPCSLLCQS